MLVELPHTGIDGGRIELRPGQLFDRRHDACVHRVTDVGATQDAGEGVDVVGADEARASLQRHHEREIARAHPLGQQGELGVAEDGGGGDPIGEDGGAGDDRRRHLRVGGGEGPAYGGAEDRPQGDLLRAQAQKPGQSPGAGADRHGTGGGEPAGQPPERRGQRRAGHDPVPQRRDLARLLEATGYRLGPGQDDPAGGSGGGPPAGPQAGPGQGADAGGEEDALRAVRPGLRHGPTVPADPAPCG